MTPLKLTIFIVTALLVWLWATRETIRPSLIMNLGDVLRAQKAANKPSFCMWEMFDWPGGGCRVA
jgi:hypothetical protein